MEIDEQFLTVVFNHPLIILIKVVFNHPLTLLFVVMEV